LLGGQGWCKSWIAFAEGLVVSLLVSERSILFYFVLRVLQVLCIISTGSSMARIDQVCVKPETTILTPLTQCVPGDWWTVCGNVEGARSMEGERLGITQGGKRLTVISI